MTRKRSRSGPKRNIVLEGRIRPRIGTVTFQTAGSAIDPFEVHFDENVRWKLDGVPAGRRVRIRFVQFPHGSEPTLLAHGNTLEGDGAIDGGMVQFAAPDGPYAYVIELVDGKGSVTKLDVITHGETTTRAKKGGLRKEMLFETGGKEEGNPGG
jgi:hypothetical protein